MKILLILLAIFATIVVLLVLLALDHFVLRPPQITGFERYVGFWVGNGVELRISEQGRLSYERTTKNTSASINGPIRSVSESEISAGFSILAKTFHITEPPREEGGVTQMKIDDVLLIRAPQPGALSVPETSALTQLVRDTLGRFNTSVLQSDFSDFYQNHTAVLWKNQISEERLTEIFAEFSADTERYQGYISDKTYADEDIVITKPPILTEAGQLVVHGYVNGTVLQEFEIDFLYEHPEWKVMGISVAFREPN